MKQTLFILMILGLSIPSNLQSQVFLLESENKLYQPPKTNWKSYEVSKPVKQIQMVEYRRDSKGEFDTYAMEGYEFNSDGNLKNHAEQNKYSQNAKQYNYTNGHLSGVMSGSAYGATEIKYKLDEKNNITAIGNYSFTYTDDGKLSNASDGDKKYDSFKHEGLITTVNTQPSNVFKVYYNDQLILKRLENSDFMYAYTYPYDGNEALFNKAKLSMDIYQLKNLASEDISKFNKTILGTLDESRKNAPLSIAKKNDKGDWTLAVYKPMHDPSVHKYYFRKIIYADGTESGWDKEADLEFIKQYTKQPK